MRLLGENAALVTEAKTLRTDLKSQQVENRKMQSILGIGNKFMLPEDAEKKLDQAIATKSEVHKKYREKFKVSFHLKFQIATSFLLFTIIIVLFYRKAKGG